MGIARLGFLVAAVTAITSTAHAAIILPSYEGEIKSQIQFKEDVYDHDSTPFDTYLKLDIKDIANGTDLYFYGRLWKDFGYGTDWDLDLYQLYARVPYPHSFLTVGRQFISEGFETYTADAVKFTYYSDSGIRSTFYIGKPRYFEPNTYSGDDLLGGFKFDYKGFYLGFEHLRDDGSVKKSSFVFGTYRPFSYNAAYYSRLEVDVAHGELTDFVGGINYYPGKWRFNFETEFYNPVYTFDNNEVEDSIFAEFSPLGRELRFTESAYYTLSDEWQLFERYTFSDIQTEGKDNGHLLKVGFINDKWFTYGLRTSGAVIYQNSWMGILRGLEFSFNKWLSKKFSVIGTADLARYDKVTYGKQWANAFYLKGIYRATDFSSFEVGLDYRKNEDFDRDVRVMLRYNCLFWGAGIKAKEARK